MQQIVYTRCKPRRDLGNGRVVEEEGFGANFSEGLISKGLIQDPLLLKKRIEKKNAAEEGGDADRIFRSYEYFYNADGGSMLGQENLRLYNAADVRPNGKKHRPGNYIKQYMVGKFENYPCLLFGSACWDADNEEENFYYHDNGEPLEFLPELEPEYGDESKLREDVRNFIANGRSECVKKLVSVVASEILKPEEQRRFIVIRDLPEQVEMWVEAVEFALPLYLAEQISFSTNVTASAQISDYNTFYCDADNKLMDMYPKKAMEEGGKKRYHSMIVGIHPADRGSAYVDPERDGATFWLLDGQSKTFEGTESFDIKPAYFDAVVRMDKDMMGFCSFLSGLRHIKAGSQAEELYKLFDAYQYLFCSAAESRKYEETIKCLSAFEKYEREPYTCSQRLAEEVWRMYLGFFLEDLKKELPLLRRIVTMDHAQKLKGSIEALLTKVYLQMLQSEKAEIASVDKLDKSCAALYPSMKQHIEKGFRENIPKFREYARNWDSAQSYYMFRKLCDCFKTSETMDEAWYQDKDNAAFIEILFVNVSRDHNISQEMLAYVKNSPVYVDLAVRGMCLDSGTWGESICQTMEKDAELEKVCDRLLAEGLSLEQYEGFLTRLLVAGRKKVYMNKAILCFREEEDRSVEFVNIYLNQFGEDARELEWLMDEMDRNALRGESKECLYKAVKRHLDTAEVSQITTTLAVKFENWRREKKRPAGRPYLLVFLDELKSAGSKEEMIDLLERYSAKEPIEITSDGDMELVVQAAGELLSDNEVLVSMYYHLMKKKEKENPFRFRMLFADPDKPEKDEIIRYIDLELTPKGEVLEQYLIYIKNDLCEVLKNQEDIDKIEKAVLNATKGKKKKYKRYFEMIRDEKVRDKEKAKKAKGITEKAPNDSGVSKWISKWIRKK